MSGHVEYRQRWFGTSGTKHPDPFRRLDRRPVLVKVVLALPDRQDFSQVAAGGVDEEALDDERRERVSDAPEPVDEPGGILLGYPGFEHRDDH